MSQTPKQACERVDPADVLFLIAKHLRLCGLSASAMALLHESRMDMSWLCGPSREMLLLREWVFTGDFTRARTLLQPLASVLTGEELCEAMCVIEKQELLESLLIADDEAPTHIQRQKILDELRARKRELDVDASELALCVQTLLANGESIAAVHYEASRESPPPQHWDVNEARMRCFEQLVPFFRGEIRPEDCEYKYLTMAPTQLMALVQDGVAYHKGKEMAALHGQPDDCISTVSESHKTVLDQLEDASSEHLFLGESSQRKRPSARVPSKARMLSRSVDLSRVKSNWTSGGERVGGAAGDGLENRRGQFGSTSKPNKSHNSLAMSLDFDRARLATRQRGKTMAGRGRELTMKEGNDEEDQYTGSEEGEVQVAASTPDHVEGAKAAPLTKVLCDSATQTEAPGDAALSVAPSEGLRDIGKPGEEALTPVVSNNASRVGPHMRLSREPETPESWMLRQIFDEKRSLGTFNQEELKTAKPDASFASDASRSVCIDDDDGDDPFMPVILENKSPISKYLEEEDLEDDDDEVQDEQNLDHIKHEANHDATDSLSVVHEESSLEERRPERYDQLTLDHIVRASVVAEVKEAHAVRAIDLNLDGSQLVIGTNARALRVFDLVSPLSSALSSASSISTRSGFSTPHHSFLPLLPVLVERHKHHQSSIYCVAYNNSNSFGSSASGKAGGGGIIASGDADSSIKVLSLVTNKELLIQNHPGKIRALHFAADNLLWSSATGDLRIRCWDLNKCLSSTMSSSCMDLDGHVGEIQTLAFSQSSSSSKSSLLLSASLDKTLRLWDTRSGKCERIVARTAHPAFTLAFDPTADNESCYFASGHQDGSVAMWDLRMKSHPVQTLAHHQDECRTISWSPDGKWLLSSSFDGTICIMYSQQQKLSPMASYHQHQDKVLQAQWHPTKPAIVTTGADKLVKLWAFS